MSRNLIVRGTRIIASIAHHGPAVIAGGLENIDLVSAVGAVFVLPHIAGTWMHRQAERPSMAQGVHLRSLAGLSDERIVRRNGAVVAQTEHLTAQGVGILGILAGQSVRR